MSKIKLGAYIPVYGGSYKHNLQKVNFEILQNMAQILDENNFDSLWIPDHLFNAVGSGPSNFASTEDFRKDAFESWTTLSALSSITKKIKLSNIVTCNLFRHPSLLAKMASTLDNISNGRLILGIGAGWFKPECDAYGIPWKKYHDRVKMLEESLTIINLLWAKNQSSFNGEFYKLDNAYLEPKPIQKPRPKIWVGGCSDRMINIAAKFGDGIDILANNLFTKDEIKNKINSFKLAGKNIGRDPDSLSVSHSCYLIIDPDERNALKQAQLCADEIGVSLENYVNCHLVGTAESIADKILSFEKIGVEKILLQLPHSISVTQNFCDNVVPLLK